MIVDIGSGVPASLKEHVVQHVATRQARSIALLLLTAPRLTEDFCEKTMPSVIWNSLPEDYSAGRFLCNCICL